MLLTKRARRHKMISNLERTVKELDAKIVSGEDDQTDYLIASLFAISQQLKILADDFTND